MRQVILVNNDRQSFNQYMNEVSDRIASELTNVLPDSWNVPESLSKSMSYSLMAGGKRLRPLLVIAACEAGGGSTEAAIPVACAVEMVHTYSLVHDDLPAMDDDDFRRGKPTNHKVFGEATAILAGDALLTHAFYMVVQSSRRFGIPADRVLSIVEDLAEYAGPRGMVGGQAADMEGEQGITKLEELEYIHLHKTSDLIMFSLIAGGRVAGCSNSQIEALRAFGERIGLAFQIQDDILDLIGDETKLGKSTQSDLKQQKVTYPYFIGLEASKQEVKRLTDEAKALILEAGLKDPGRLLEIADFLMSRDH